MDEKQATKPRKVKVQPRFWLTAAAILAGIFFVFAITSEDTAQKKPTRKWIAPIDRMLSLSADFNKSRVEIIHDDHMAGVSVNEVYCSRKSIAMTGTVYADATKEYKGVEVYRAGITENGGYGEFRKIGVCTDLREEGELPPVYRKNELIRRYAFTYTDRVVEPGKEYAYRMYAYEQKPGDRPALTSLPSRIYEAFTGSIQGKYECSIVQNTKKKLILKLSGKSEENGLLKYRFGCVWSAAKLVYKDKLYEPETVKMLQMMKYSYDGKKWYDDSPSKNKNGVSFAMLTIKGKESVYLWFVKHTFLNEFGYLDIGGAGKIDFSGCQYAQMMLADVLYNNCRHLRLRFNFTSGEARVGGFYRWDQILCRLETEWENNIFQSVFSIDGEFYDDYDSYDNTQVR